MRTWLLPCAFAIVIAACSPGREDGGNAAIDSSGPRAGADGTPHDHARAGDGVAPRHLLPIMQQLGSDMATLTHGLMTDDQAAVAAAAAAIAQHAPIAPEEIHRIASVLGADMNEFEERDAAVHAASVRLHEAARSGSPQTVVARLNEVQAGCVACHQRFRERLRTTAR